MCINLVEIHPREIFIIIYFIKTVKVNNYTWTL